MIWFTLLYMIGSAAYIYLSGEKIKGHAGIKAAPIFLLAVAVYFSATLQSPVRWLILAALLLSAAGDIFLALDDDGNFFVSGLASFLIAHIFYAIAFAQSTVFQTLSLLPICLIIALGIFVTWRIWDGLDELKLPVSLYILISMVMGFSAAVHAPLSWTLIAGSVIFMLSDSVIAWDKFWNAVPRRDLLVMGTYYAAQLLIFMGITS